MTATPSPKGVEPKEPEPKTSALVECVNLMEILGGFDVANEAMAELEALKLTGNENCVNCDGRPGEPHAPVAIIRGTKCPACTLTAERDEAQKERDEFKAANAKLEAEAKRMREIINRTLIGALGVLHGGKVEVRRLEADAQLDKEKEGNHGN